MNAIYQQIKEILDRNNIEYTDILYEASPGEFFLNGEDFEEYVMGETENTHYLWVMKDNIEHKYKIFSQFITNNNVMIFCLEEVKKEELDE